MLIFKDLLILSGISLDWEELKIKAIILAAGMGTRLGNNKPKSLTRISNGKTILDYQIERIGKKIGLDNIVIVLGYKKEMIIEKFPNLVFVYNKSFRTSNTSKSWLAGIRKFNEDLMLIDGDVYFDEKVLSLILRSNQTSFLVNDKECASDETKYNLNKNGYINEISKDLNYYEGEVLGIRLICKKELSVLKKNLEKANDGDYGDKVLGRLTKNKKIKVNPVYLNNYFCKGINYKKTLEFVKQHISKQTIDT